MSLQSVYDNISARYKMYEEMYKKRNMRTLHTSVVVDRIDETISVQYDKISFMVPVTQLLKLKNVKHIFVRCQSSDRKYLYAIIFGNMDVKIRDKNDKAFKINFFLDSIVI